MILLAIFAGLCVTLQAGMNKIIGSQWGLASVVAFSCISAGIYSLIYYVLIQKSIIPSPAYLQDINAWSVWKWWYFIPGILGFCIVLFMPWAIIKIGANKAIILAIAAQMISSIVWDLFIEKTTINTLQYLGAALTFIGAALVIFA